MRQSPPMAIPLDRLRRTVPMAVGAIAFASVVVLITWDFFPTGFPSRSHEVIGALPLGLIAVAYLAHQAVHRPDRKQLVKAILLALAFLSWAANQFWPDAPQATLFNDIAIALFVLDLLWVIIGWPSDSAESD